LVQTFATGLGGYQGGTVHLGRNAKHQLSTGGLERLFAIFRAVCNVEINRSVKV
jgi:hypothetical protein